MRITTQQQGMIALYEFAKFAMMGSDGEIELNPPLTNDDGRDFEVHRRRHFGGALSMQVRSVRKLTRRNKTWLISMTIKVPVTELGAHRTLWYFLAHLDLKRMELGNPCFLVPSAALYRLAPRSRYGRMTTYRFAPNMSPTSRDMWRRYRVDTKDVGQRLLEILNDLERSR